MIFSPRIAESATFEYLYAKGLIKKQHTNLFYVDGCVDSLPKQALFVYEELYRVLQFDQQSEYITALPNLNERLFERLFTEPLSNSDLVHHARTCLTLPTKYVYGGLMELVCPELITRLTTEYPSFYTKEKIDDYSGKEKVWGCDCSGLIKSFFFKFDRDCYDPFLDRNSSTLMKLACCKGPITTLPECPGLILHLEGHVGVYVGNGLIIESTLNNELGDGVVITRLSDRAWVSWFCCPFVDYSASWKTIKAAL